MSDSSQSPVNEQIPERYVPEEMRGQLVAAEHIARYTWASALCGDRQVLDAGCGTGYGSALLAERGAAEVVAIDRSEAALELARETVGSQVRCEQGDVTDLPHPDHSFDVIVCFEVIEHLEDQEKALDEFARVLRPDGLLIVSSPNRDRYVPGNPHHIHELVRDEMQAMLDARFGAARIYSQHVMLASTVTADPAAPITDAVLGRAAPPAPEDELYLLAVAGRELPPAPSPTVELGHFAEPRAWLDYIDGLNRHIDFQQTTIAGLEDREDERADALAQLATAQSRLARLTAAEGEAEALRAELETTRQRAVEERKELTAELEKRAGELAEVRETLSMIVSSKSWTITRPLRTVAEKRR